MRHKLEKHYRNMQDIEFTIQKSKLWMLQTRNGKRTGFAAVRVAVDMVAGRADLQGRGDFVEVHPAGDLNQLLQPIFDPEAKKAASKSGKLLTKGIHAGPGAATGKIMFTPQKAEALKQANPTAALILVRKETTPEDMRGMKAALGILTAFGGVVVARGPGQPADGQGLHRRLPANWTSTTHAGTVTVKGKVLKEGDDISIDGFTGEVIAGQSPPSRARWCRC